MQTRLSEDKNVDQCENYVAITDYKTPHNQHEIHCETCGKVLFADTETFDRIARMIEQGLDATFLCNECKEESERLNHEER